MDNIQDLTIVIPTYNRTHHLERLLTYYKNSGLQNKFIVLDSSSEEDREINKARVASCGEQFKHHVFPHTMPVAEKLHGGLKLVETTYSAFCADDDVIFPETLKKAVKFISEHPEYVCVDGIYLNFRPDANNIHCHIEYGSRGIKADQASARVFRLFQKYESMFYAVFRTKDLMHLFSFVKDIPSLHYQELFQAAGALLMGKSHRMSEIYAGRQACEPAEPMRDKWQTYYWFVDDTTEFLSHYVDYRKDLWRFYQQFGDGETVDEKEFILAMDLAHMVFFSTNCPPVYFYSRLNYRDHIITDLDIDNVLEDLKSLFRRKIEAYIKFGALVLKNKGFFNSILPQHTPGEKRVKMKDQKEWGCMMPTNLLWIKGKQEFRYAFSELSRYLGDVDQS